MRVSVLLLSAAALLGCMERHLTLPPPPPSELAPPTPPPPGSLWHPELASNYQVLDVRAHFPGDLLTIVISESSTGKKDASTDAKASSSISANVEDFFGIPAGMFKFLPKGLKPDSLVKAKEERESSGEGETKRTGTLTASITVRVVAVDAGGNLRVQGDKVVSVNREDQHIVLTGMVRPEDIANDNSVLSSRLADARIDYYGRGTVGSKQGTPLVHTLFDWVWPF